MDDLKLFFLGTPRIEHVGEPLSITLSKNLALLAYLVITDEPHRREAIINLLWPELDPSRARAGLRRNLSTLKKTLCGEYIQADRTIIWLDRDASIWLDVNKFRDLLEKWREHNHLQTVLCSQCVTNLQKAVDLYRGDFLEGFSLRDSPNFDEWQFFQTEGLRQDLSNILERLIFFYRQKGKFSTAIPYARRWLALDVLNEPAHRYLMELYARSNQRAAAVRQFEECERILEEELDVKPDDETIQLFEEIKSRRIYQTPQAQSEILKSGGETILNDRYKLVSELGRGGTSIVYQAYDLLLKRDVAIKVLHAGMLGTEGQARLLGEAQAAARLNHTNIVTVYDAGESDRSTYIVMEHIEGKALVDYKPETFDEILNITKQLCSALEYAHSHGIIHRDLKPENIMITSDGTVKLGDFGLARSVASRITSTGDIIGTTYYLAPELALGQNYDGRADLYALGVLLYEMTTRQLPFTAEDQLAVISQHIHAPVVPPRARNAKIPPVLEELILSLLNKDPDYRPDCASDVLQLLGTLNLHDFEATQVEEPSVLNWIGRGRLIGREHEMQTGKVLWNRTLTGKGQMLVLSGEAGIGKTRLVRELVTQAKVTGGRVLQGACYVEGGLPYAPFVQILRRVFELKGGIDIDLPEFVIANLITLAPTIRLLYPNIEPAPLLEDPVAEQQRLFDNMVTFFVALSEHSPLLLVLEDIHWAGSGTLSLLRHLARHTRQSRVMVVVTNRDVEADEARLLYETILDLKRERLVTQLRLPRLDLENTRDLLELLFAQEVTPEFQNCIYQETEGNPFYIEEVCKALVESGKMRFKDGQWHRSKTSELGIPDSVRVAIQSRVRILPPETQEILLHASVLGREFDFRTLAATSELDHRAIIDGLDNAERAQIIEQISQEVGGTYSFVHALIPSTLVDGARSLHRRRLHLRAAQAIQSLRPDDYESLVYHFDHAGDEVNATTYRMKAGDRARASYVHQEAISNYQRALKFFIKVGRFEDAARTLMKLGLSYHNAFDFDSAREAYQEGFALWQRAAEVQTSDQIPHPPHALRIATFKPSNLGPGIGMDLPSAVFMDQLFSGLVEVTPEMSVTPDVAQSWEVFDNGGKYVFHLRNDVYWSDGVPVTAHDFIYGLKRCLDPKREWLPGQLLYDIQGAQSYHNGQLTNPDQLGIRAVDDYTLAIQLEGPTSYFPYVVAFSPMFPIPQHIVQKFGEEWSEPEHIVTNGPFVLKNWEKKERLVLTRNPLYHGRFPGNLEEVEFLFFSRHARFLDMYSENELDVCGRLTPSECAYARQRYPDEYIYGSWPSIDFIGYDTQRPPFDDRRVRRAFTLASDRKMLADVFLKGYAFPATGGLVPPGMPGHSPKIGLPYNPDLARKLLAEAGYPHGKGFPAVECIVRDDFGHDILSEQLQVQWLENLGVDITWEVVKWKNFPDRMSQRLPHMWLTGFWADYPDPDDILRVLWWLPPGWQTDAYSQLVQYARRTLDQEQRIIMYQQADRILIEEAPVLPLCYGRSHLLVKPWVKKYFATPNKWWFLKNVILEPHDPE